jgi:3-hydroxyisobutyrate dehydrogenase
VTAGTGQAIALAGALGLDPQLFLDVIAGGPLDLPYAQLKGKSMIADEFPTSFAVSGVVKDLGLISAAMRGVDVHDGVVEALGAAFRTADTAGHGDEDMAAVVHAFRPRR